MKNGNLKNLNSGPVREDGLHDTEQLEFAISKKG
jgi:hypothetical protein